MKNRNLFTKFVSHWTDKEVLKGIDNQSEFEKDVYNAILSVSLQRNLISKDQFDRFFISDKRPNSEEIEADDQIQLNPADYWKCPKCGQVVEMNFEVCWNCQNYKPEKIAHPTIVKIIDYQSYKKPLGIFKAGFGLIGLGIIILI